MAKKNAPVEADKVDVAEIHSEICDCYEAIAALTDDVPFSAGVSLYVSVYL